MKIMKPFQVIFLALMLVACSRTFFVKIEGELQTGIQFCFYERLTDEKPKTHELREFSVQKLTNNNWKDVWIIEGPFNASCLVYGAESENYQTLVKAETMSADTEYRVGASDTKSPIGYASLRFEINKTGKPMVSE